MKQTKWDDYLVCDKINWKFLESLLSWASKGMFIFYFLVSCNFSEGHKQGRNINVSLTSRHTTQ